MDRIDELHRVFAYDPESGVITRKFSKRTDRIGKQTGCPESRGYLQIKFQGRLLMAHHIAWALFYGIWPEQEVDHENRIKGDNRIKNLRPATRIQNIANTGVRKDNMLGIKGVRQIGESFEARIKTPGKLVSLGRYETAADASRAFDNAHRALHGKFSEA